MISDWIFDNFGWFITAGIVLVLVGTYAAVSADKDAREKFMRQCVKDHKEYECIAMWRAGDRSSSVVPMPIIIPMGNR